MTASGDNAARVWDAASGKQIGEPMKHEIHVNSAQFSPDGQRVVTASNDNTARIWDAASGKQISEPMKHANAVNSAQFSPDGQRVVIASYDNTARLWDVHGAYDEIRTTKENIFLLAELAEATGGVTLETGRRGRESQIAGPRTDQEHRGKRSPRNSWGSLQK